MFHRTAQIVAALSFALVAQAHAQQFISGGGGALPQDPEASPDEGYTPDDPAGDDDQSPDADAPPADDGPMSSAAVSAGAPACQDASSAVVGVQATLITTAGVEGADITLSLGGKPVRVGSLGPDAFVSDGAADTARFATEVSLANGEHAVTLCFVLRDADGREIETVCDTAQIGLDCTPSETCRDDRLLFGDVVTNRALCTGRGTPHIPIHFRGSAYDGVVVEIEGPDGFGLSLPMRRAGESCKHHAVWDTRGGNHGGEGAYTFSVFTEGGALLTTLERPVACGLR